MPIPPQFAKRTPGGGAVADDPTKDTAAEALAEVEPFVKSARARSAFNMLKDELSSKKPSVTTPGQASAARIKGN